MAERFANDAYTTLNGAINNAVTSLTVVDGALFPTSGSFRIRIDDEFMLVTAVAGNVWTVTRAVEGLGVGAGTAASHSNGAEIRHILTAGALANTGSPAQEHFWASAAPGTPHAVNDEFAESAMDAKWSRAKHATTRGTWALGDGKLNYAHDLATGGDDLDVWCQSDTISVGDYIEVGFRYWPVPSWFGPFVGISSSATYGSGTQVGTFMHWNGANMRWMLNTYVGFAGRTQDGTINDRGNLGLIGYARVKYESANTFGLYQSLDGKKFWTIQSNYSRTLTPSHWVVGIHTLSSPVVGGAAEIFYVRKNPA